MPETDAQRKTRLENRLDQVIQEIEALDSGNSSTRKGAGIDTSGDGVNLSHHDYRRLLYEEKERLEKSIATIEGPFIENLEIW
jgi:predicted RNase H-like nuclease (RuvC/YqgF family)